MQSLRLHIRCNILFRRRYYLSNESFFVCSRFHHMGQLPNWLWKYSSSCMATEPFSFIGILQMSLVKAGFSFVLVVVIILFPASIFNTWPLSRIILAPHSKVISIVRCSVPTPARIFPMLALNHCNIINATQANSCNALREHTESTKRTLRIHSENTQRTL